MKSMSDDMTLLERLDAVTHRIDVLRAQRTSQDEWVRGDCVRELRIIRAEIEKELAEPMPTLILLRQRTQELSDLKAKIEKRDEAVRKVAEQMDGHIEICQTIRDHVCPADMWSARLREALK